MLGSTLFREASRQRVSGEDWLPERSPGRIALMRRTFVSSVVLMVISAASLRAQGPVQTTPLDRSSLDTTRSEEHTSELQSRLHLVCRLLLEKKKTRTSSSLYRSHQQ